jgi:hypothetical protein
MTDQANEFVDSLKEPSARGRLENVKPHVPSQEDQRLAKRRADAAARQRLRKERRRDGLRCVTLEVRETEIGVLVQRGLLDAAGKTDTEQVKMAFYKLLDQALAA